MSVLRGNNGPRYRHTATDSAYETITIDKLTPIIGAEVGGVDLSAPLANHQMDEIHRALAENSVIFFGISILPRNSIWRSGGCSAICTYIPLRRTPLAIRS